MAVLATFCAGVVDDARAEAPPARVVSLNLCFDQLALALAAPGQLVGVSDVAHDPLLSPRWRAARALPAVRMRVEEILGLRPDLVLLDAQAPAQVSTLLRRAGVRVVPLREAATFDEGLVRLRDVAQALGRAEVGTALADDVERQRSAILGQPAARRPLAAVWQANGFTVGAGTMPDDLLRLAGWRNLAAERSMGAFAPLALETLLRAAPDLLILDGASSERPSLAEALLVHRALRQEFKGARTLVLPPGLWLCAGPQNLDALRQLVAARRRIESAP